MGSWRVGWGIRVLVGVGELGSWERREAVGRGERQEGGSVQGVRGIGSSVEGGRGQGGGVKGDDFFRLVAFGRFH